MVFNNWKRKLLVNGEYIGECTELQFNDFTLDVTAIEDEVNCFETVLRFYNSCIVSITLTDDRLALVTKNPLHRE